MDNGTGDPASFDVEAWLGNTSLPTQVVTVIGQAGLRAEYDILEQELRAVRATGDDRLGRSAPAGQDILARMAAIEDEMRASQIHVVLRSATEAEKRQVQVDSAKGPDGPADDLDYNLRMFAVTVVSPRLTLDQAARFRDAIGDQWQQVLEGMLTLMRGRPSVPSLAAVSAFRAQRPS